MKGGILSAYVSGPLSGWLPPQASRAAPAVDSVFWLIFWIAAFFFLVIVVVTVLFIVRYRERKWTAPEPSPTHNGRLEATWSGVPVILILLIFGVSTGAYLELTEPPAAASAFEIHVTGRKWSWSFEYPDGTRSSELHAVVNEPVLLTMSADDVLHSLHIPAFRVKQDLVPGRYTKMWFEATEVGTFPVYCAEYCGTNHSTMLSAAVIHPDRAAFDAWSSKAGDLERMSLPEVGQLVWRTTGCVSCHSIDGTTSVGPTFKGLWGKVERLADGGEVTVDENYLRESIIEPRARMVLGYPPVMPPTVLGERELRGIIEYIKSLEEKSDGR